MTLYELTNQYTELLEMLSDPDVDEQTIYDTLEAIDGEIEEKADGYARVISEMEARLAGVVGQIKRLDGYKQTLANNIQRVKDNLQNAMIATGKRKFKTDLFSFSVQKNGGALPVIVDVAPEDLPDELVTITRTPNKKAIAELLERATEYIPIAHFGERGESLRIR